MDHRLDHQGVEEIGDRHRVALCHHDVGFGDASGVDSSPGGRRPVGDQVGVLRVGRRHSPHPLRVGSGSLATGSVVPPVRDPVGVREPGGRRTQRDQAALGVQQEVHQQFADRPVRPGRRAQTVAGGASDDRGHRRVRPVEQSSGLVLVVHRSSVRTGAAHHGADGTVGRGQDAA
ncbi:hypothetical protein P4R38_14615 [Luteipulveratus sp. YIM 133296]|uniref:Uncharacterized protein n=1 Tax=Luteipulveratus flavus TaxID=3031728 RepID=A0ABT6CBP5_9MICO|nr:hypothetical protein [Luteipulveratus sp. YIM 133296]MDF8265479.1 hypothetical protein [Luteipulveratus sp. YIM 133296]